MTEPSDFNQQIIETFRANGGELGGTFGDMPVLLLHHRRRTGTERVNPVAYQKTPEGWAVFASAAGSPKNPDWFHNLVANPDTTAEIGTATVAVHARQLTGTERDQVWETQKRDVPGFAEYEEKVTGIRQIPVILLEPAG